MALEDYKVDMMRCSRCSYCKWIPLAQVKSWKYARGCPSIEAGKFHAYSGSGRLNIALALLLNRINYSDKMLEIIYKCQLCGSCDTACKMCRYMEPLDTMLELRARCVEDGQLLPQNIPVIESLRKEDNMKMKPKAERGKWAEGLDVKNVTTDKAKVLFHAGCQLCFDEELWQIARSGLTLLRNAGVDIGIMGKDESCCGGRAYDMGYRGEFTKFAENNIEAWKNAGVTTVVVACSDCNYAFKHLYPELGSKVEVLHIVEYIERLIKEGKLKFKKNIPMKVTYHDPCHLGRLGEKYVPWQGELKKIRNHILVHDPPKYMQRGANGVYEPPRNILRSIPGLELVEMERIKEYSWCCGAGGGVKDAYPDFAISTALDRIDEARSTGAEAIVSACSWCKRNFVDAVNSNGEKMKVYDIIELVEQAI